MLDELIKLLLSMPLPVLSEHSQRDFFARSQHLENHLSLVTFDALLKEKPSKSFTSSELRQIRNYLERWPDFIKEFHYVLEIIHLAWFEMYGRPVSGDDIIEIVCRLMPIDPIILLDLKKKFYFTLDVSRDGECNYYCTVFGSAAEILLSPLYLKAELVPLQPNLYDAYLQKLKNPTYYNLLFILVKLSALCQYRMQVCEALIFNSLQKIPNHHYVLGNLPRSELILKMMNDLHTEPFISDAKLAARVRRHLAYQDFESTLSQSNILSIIKLAELAHKFEVYKDFIAEDFNTIDIELTERIRDFLGIPPVKKTSLFSLFVTIAVKIPLNTFITYLTKKLEELIDEREEYKQPGFEIPEPEQLADLLRQSF